MTAVKNMAVGRRTGRRSPSPYLHNADILHGRRIAHDEASPAARRAGESQPADTTERQNRGGRSQPPTPIGMPREESTMSALAIAATPSIVPTVGERTVVITFHPQDPYGLVDIETTPDLSGEALIETLEHTIRHLRIYTRGYHAEMVADRRPVRS